MALIQEDEDLVGDAGPLGFGFLKRERPSDMLTGDCTLTIQTVPGGYNSGNAPPKP